MAVIHDNTSYGRGPVEPVLDALGLTPVALEPLDPSGDSIAVHVASIARQKPDIVFAVGTVSRPPVLVALRARGITAPVIAGDGWSGIDTAMTVQNVAIALPFSSSEDRAEVTRFVAAFRARFRVGPDAYAALSYDATIALARAADTGRTRRGTCDAIGRSMHLLRIDGATRSFGVMQ